MYPHERSLVARLANKPFALLGINSDTDREALRKTLVDQQITWRSWWDGGVDGPIHRQWNVVARPCVYVLDHHGVIRFKNVFGDKLDQAVDELLDELRREAAGAGAL